MKNLFYLKMIIITLLFSIKLFAGENQKQAFLYFEESEIEKLKSEVEKSNPQLKPYLEELQQFANVFLKKGPWSVTDYKSPSISKDPQDYYSESPYWWPNPDNPDAPFIRKDGVRNPNRFMGHKSSLNRVYQSTFVLVLAGYLFDEPKYISHALNILEVWFINPEKRMNPNLNYAQAIPNKSPGRGVGIIDTHRWTKLVEAFYLLDYTGQWPVDHKKEIVSWFKDYLEWLNTSKNGLDEKKQGNNHTTWWCAQVAAYSRLTGNEDLLRTVADYVKEDVIPNQIEGNGSMPEEEKRTRSLSYMCFNLDAYSLFIRNVQSEGSNLWQFENAKGGSVKKTIDYMIPYLQNPEKWTNQQIVKLSKKEPIFLYLAGKEFPDEPYLDLYKSKRHQRELSKLSSSYDPFLLMTNLVSMANY
ncbi:MAG: hypothetical protein D8M58_09365 [Calditrichaeota bacterium]|nr:MAG: hypothetical protein DWQ03_08740 [Calditrichota bacterium]MBL1205595.1 hypothetical protein [Calditrichota bacterium]NOG45424.1 alginate lyase family protein [Calditrichota bacterium]